MNNELIYSLFLMAVALWMILSFILGIHFSEKERICRENAPIIFFPVTVLLSISFIYEAFSRMEIVPQHILIFSYSLNSKFGDTVLFLIWMGIGIYTQYLYCKKNNKDTQEITKYILLLIGLSFLLFVLYIL